MEDYKAILEEVNSPEFRKKHQIPGFPVPADNITKKNPDWKKDLRESMWWEADNLETGASFPAFAAGNEPRWATEYQQFQKLHAILLSIGGSETCFPLFEEDMLKILSRGRFWKGTSKLVKGDDNQCHANSAYLWDANHKDKDVAICTGYALSKDGCWRQHSWLVHHYETSKQHRTRLVETTVKRVAYYGVELTQKECEDFLYNAI